MAISFIGVGTPSGGVGDVTPTLPSGLQAQDFMLLLVETGGAVDGGEVVTAPSGWTILSASGSAQGTSGQGATRLSMFYRFYQSGDGNPTITDPGDHAISQIAAFRGVDLVTPATTRNFSSASNTTTRTTAAVSVVADQLLCIVGANSLNQLPTITNSAGLTQTQRVLLSTTNGDDGALRFYTAPVSSTASITGTTTVASSDAILVCAFALNPLSTITATVTGAMGAFAGSAEGTPTVAVSATADLGAFSASAETVLYIATDAVAALEAFGASAEGGMLVEAEITGALGAFEATAEVLAGDVIPIDVDATAEIVGFGAGLIWVFVGRLEVPGDDDYNITIPKLFRAIDIPGIDRTAKVPGLERTLQVP